VKNSKLCDALRELSNSGVHYQTENKTMQGLETRTAEFQLLLILFTYKRIKEFRGFFFINFRSVTTDKREMINVMSKCHCSSKNKVKKLRFDNKLPSILC
jgi:hypothetical protein